MANNKRAPPDNAKSEQGPSKRTDSRTDTSPISVSPESSGIMQIEDPSDEERRLQDREMRERLFHRATVALKQRREKAFSPPLKSARSACIDSRASTSSSEWEGSAEAPEDWMWEHISEMTRACRCPDHRHVRHKDPKAVACRFVPYRPVIQLNGVRVGFSVLSEREAFAAWWKAGWFSLPYNGSSRRKAVETESDDSSEAESDESNESEDDQPAPTLLPAETWGENQRYRRYLKEFGIDTDGNWHVRNFR